MGKKIKFKIASIACLLVLVICCQANAREPIISWNFSEINNRKTIEKQSGIADTLEGNFNSAPGISGKGLRLDGFTACLKHNDRNMPLPGDEITVESWVSLGNYPWNWCPVLSTESNETKGYHLMIEPHGEASFQVSIGEQWISCST